MKALSVFSCYVHKCIWENDFLSLAKYTRGMANNFEVVKFYYCKLDFIIPFMLTEIQLPTLDYGNFYKNKTERTFSPKLPEKTLRMQT